MEARRLSLSLDDTVESSGESGGGGGGGGAVLSEAGRGRVREARSPAGELRV